MDRQAYSSLAVAVLAFCAASPGVALDMIPVPIAAGTSIHGKCQSGGMIATPGNVETLLTSVALGTEVMATVIHAAQLQQIAALKNMTNQLNQSQADFSRKLEASRSEQRYLDQTTGINAVDSGCDDQAQASKTAQGLQAARAFKTGVTSTKSGGSGGVKTVKASSVGNASGAAKSGVQPLISPVDNIAQATVALSETPEAQWESATLTNPKASDDDVAAVIAHMASPMPKKGISGSDTGASSVSWKTDATVDFARSTLAVNALSLVAEGHRATVDTSGIRQEWQDSGVNMGVLEFSGNNLSPNDVFSAYVQQWYSGQGFINDVQIKGDAWQLRQQARMMAAKLWALDRGNALLERVVAMEAVMLAKDAQVYIDRANESAALATGQSARGVQ